MEPIDRVVRTTLVAGVAVAVALLATGIAVKPEPPVHEKDRFLVHVYADHTTAQIATDLLALAGELGAKAVTVKPFAFCWTLIYHLA